jgi:uncharacterized protein (TIGR00251 family)
METLIDIKVLPKTSRQRIAVGADGSITVCLTSPPVDGRANEECVACVAKKLGIAKSYVSIRRGLKGRDKTLLIKGMDKDAILQKLER